MKGLLLMYAKVLGAASLGVDCTPLPSNTSAIPVLLWAIDPLNATVGIVAKKCATCTMARCIAGTACGATTNGNRNDVREG